MSDKILVSMENAESIISQIISNIKTKITNKNISLPYTSQLTKSTFIKVDGDGSMYLSNNGSYVSLGNINNKLSKIVSNGDGTLVLRNDGTYKQIVLVFNPMNTTQVSDMVDRLNII